jgi:zinc protease|tara:strand:- start:20116 stop:21471 length:1356 start_codon:yes stop_codon:yes gene_type:complete
MNLTKLKSTVIRLSLLLLCFSNTSYAITQAEDVNTFTLSNGMKIIVLEDGSIPNANMYLFWKVGSRNEVPGITGLSHFFEHMMFNGAKKYGPKMFDRTMEAAGGSNNAYTSENLTVYTNWFPTDAIETIFDLEADRIANLAIEEKSVNSERGVVSSERTTGLENSNFRAIWQEVKGAAFRAHPYSWSVIGHASDIENWRLEDLKKYHATYYAPNNAVVVIAGDVTTEQVKQLAKKYFEPIPAQPAPRDVHTVEPEQKGERTVYVHKASVTTPNIMMAYHVPNTQHQDYYALDILNDILATGQSSRLYKSLIDEQQVASDLFTYLPESIDPNLFYIYAVAAKDISAETLKMAVVKEVNNIIKNGVNAKELEKVKNTKLVNFYRTMATINGKANTIGSYELYFGDYNKLFSAPQAYNKVTIADIQRVAKQYLIKSNRTVGILSSEKDSNDADL